MKITRNILSRITTQATVATVGIALVAGSPAMALSATQTAAQTAAQQTKLQTIITRGDQEIARRLASLTALTAKISAATKLTPSDKATLNTEVSTTTSGLTTLKAKLDAETTVDAARTDAQSILTEYRVYALVLPKVHLVKVADDIQAADTKLTTLAQTLQTRITTDKSAGKDVSALQTKLDDMNANIASAQAAASKIETGVIGLQPSDYNTDHALLSGDNTQLKTAHTDNQTAVTDAKSIAASLKSLE